MCRLSAVQLSNDGVRGEMARYRACSFDDHAKREKQTGRAALATRPVSYDPIASVPAAMTVLTTFATRLGRTLPVLRKVAGVARRAAPAVTPLTALSSRFRRALAIVREIARAALPAEMAGA